MPLTKTLSETALARLILIIATVFIANIDIHLPALPRLVDYFQTTELMVQISVMTNAISSAVLGLFYGRWGDTYGRRPTLIAAFILFLIGNIGCIFSPTIEIFLASRFIQSLGGCGIGVITITLLTDIFDGKRGVKYFNLFTMLFPLMWIISPIISAQLMKYFNWQACFVALFCWASFGAYLAWQHIPETTNAEDRHAPYPMSELGRKLIRFLTNPAYILPVIGHSLPIGCFAAYMINSSFVFIETFGYTPVEFSLIQLIPVSTLLIGTQGYNILLKRMNVAQCLKIGLSGSALVAILALLCALELIPQTPAFVLTVASLMTLCQPLIVSPAAYLGISASDPKEKSLAVGLMALIRNSMLFCVVYPAGLAFTGTITPVFTIISFTCCVLLLIMARVLRHARLLQESA